MLAEPAVLALSLAYLGLLFAVAYFGDRHQRAWSASSTIAPTVYGLSLAIYCTSWTFYGAVGRASTTGFDFILIYTGPVLVVTAGYPMLRKLVRVAKQQNVTSIADFLASRYGKSRAVGVTATLFATVGVLPYIALQLQAVSSTFRAVAEPTPWIDGRAGVVHTDTSLIVAGLMAVFTILFGVRNVQASEQHRGIMLAMAFESVVKLVALLTVGPFVLFVLFDGPSDLWRRLVDQPVILEQVTREGSPLSWVVTTLLSAMAFLCLPRQFHAAVVEHGHPASLRTARWLFPSYLVLVNVFVLPIAAAGLLLLGPRVSPDLFVLQLPLAVATTVVLWPIEERTIDLLSVHGGRQPRRFSMSLEALLTGELRDPTALAAWFAAREDDRWASYVIGVAHACLVRRDVAEVVRRGGFRMLIESEVPEGKGVSSSAALEVACLAVIAARYGVEMSGEEIATASQWAENHIAGAPCGIMDQMTSACGRRDRLLRLRCQPGTVEGHVDIPDGFRFYGIDSGIRHAVTGSDYGTVRTAAFMGYRLIADVAGLPSSIDAGNVRELDTRWSGYLANITPAEFESQFSAQLPERMTGAEFLRRYDGITDFEVQAWDGSAWVTVPGGSIGGNRNVWRKISFPALSTDHIRILVYGALAGYSRIVEVEAY